MADFPGQIRTAPAPMAGPFTFSSLMESLSGVLSTPPVLIGALVFAVAGGVAAVARPALGQLYPRGFK